MTTHSENTHYLTAANALRLALMNLSKDGIRVKSFRSNGALTSIEVERDDRLLPTEDNGKWEWYEDSGVRIFWAIENNPKTA